jgi:hypothetical protein
MEKARMEVDDYRLNDLGEDLLAMMPVLDLAKRTRQRIQGLNPVKRVIQGYTMGIMYVEQTLSEMSKLT